MYPPLVMASERPEILESEIGRLWFKTSRSKKVSNTFLKKQAGYGASHLYSQK
jgi:hypothetical protein